MTLSKAITQKQVTLDTVEDQFCSDYLKDNLRQLLIDRRNLIRALADIRGMWGMTPPTIEAEREFLELTDLVLEHFKNIEDK